MLPTRPPTPSRPPLRPTEESLRRDGRIHDEPATITRAWLQALEDDGLTLAEYVAANFEMMNRLLDAVGVGPSRQMLPIGDEIGVPLPARFA